MGALNQAHRNPVANGPVSPREGDVLGEESGLPEPKPDEPKGNEPDELDFNELDPEARDRTWGA